MVQEVDPQGAHRWRCLACGHETTRRHNLVRHVETRHTQNPGVECDICSIICPNKSALSMHVFRKHKNAVQHWLNLAMLIKLKWLIINLSAEVEAYVSQEFSEKGSSVWRCVDCGYKSDRRNNLLKHIDSIHLSEGYNCPICTKFCPSKNALQKHVKRNHWLNLINPFSCSWGLCFPRNQWKRFSSMALCPVRLWECLEKQSFKAHRLQTPEWGTPLSHLYKVLSQQKRPSDTR